MSWSSAGRIATYDENPGRWCRTLLVAKVAGFAGSERGQQIIVTN